MTQNVKMERNVVVEVVEASVSNQVSNNTVISYIFNKKHLYCSVKFFPRDMVRFRLPG